MAKEEKNTAIFVAYEEEGEPDSAVPEKNLLRAVLLNAMNDLRKDGASAHKAMEYFLNPEEEYIFSFRSVCNHLNIDFKRVLKAAGVYQRKAETRETAEEAAAEPRVEP